MYVKETYLLLLAQIFSIFIGHFNYHFSAIAVDDLTYKKFHASIRPPFAVQLEVPITGHSVGFASINLTLKNMQDTFNNASNEVLHVLTVSFFFKKNY